MSPVPDSETVLITLDYLKAKNVTASGRIVITPPRFKVADDHIVILAGSDAPVTNGEGQIRIIPSDAGTFQVDEYLDGAPVYTFHINIPSSLAGQTRSMFSFTPVQPVVQGVTVNTLLSGSGAPGPTLGIDGDYYYDTVAKFWYGPKASGAWPAGFSVVGPQGEQGLQGIQGIQGDTGPQGSPGAPGMNGLFTINRYYTAPSAARTTASLAAGTACAHPFWVGQTQTFDRIGIDVTTLAAASAVRLGIYADTGDGSPGALVVDAGTVDSTSTGAKELTISQTLTQGLYWLVTVPQGGAPTMRAHNGTLYPVGAGSLAGAVGAGGIFTGVVTAAGAVTGALPGTFPAVANFQAFSPLVAIRAAS